MSEADRPPKRRSLLPNLQGFALISQQKDPLGGKGGDIVIPNAGCAAKAHECPHTLPGPQLQQFRSSIIGELSRKSLRTNSRLCAVVRGYSIVAQGHGQYMLCVRQGLHRPLNLTHIQPVPAKGQRDAPPRQQQPPAPVPGNHEPAAGEQKSSHRAWQQPYGAQQILGQKNPQGKAPGEDGQLTHRFPISPSALKAPLRVFHRGLQSCRASERESVSAACTLSGYTPPGKSPAVVRLVSSPLPAVPVSSSLPPHRTA